MSLKEDTTSRTPARGHSPECGEEFAPLFNDSPYSLEFQSSPLYQAILLCDLPTLVERIHRYFDAGEVESVFQVDQLSGSTWIHVVCRVTSFLTDGSVTAGMIYCLSNSGVDLRQQDYQGHTALQIAAEKSLRYVMIALLRCGAQATDEIRQILTPFQSPLREELLVYYDTFVPGVWEAVEQRDVFRMSALISFWCRLKISRCGESLAAFARRVDSSSIMLEMVEGKRANMDFVHAALCGDERRMLEVVNNKNVEPDLFDWSGSHFAKEMRKLHGLSWRNMVYASKRQLPKRRFTSSHHMLSEIGEDSEVVSAEDEDPLPKPQSLRQTVIECGFDHVLYLVPDWRHRRTNRGTRSSTVCWVTEIRPSVASRLQHFHKESQANAAPISCTSSSSRDNYHAFQGPQSSVCVLL